MWKKCAPWLGLMAGLWAGAAAAQRGGCCCARQRQPHPQRCGCGAGGQLHFNPLYTAGGQFAIGGGLASSLEC